MNTDLVEFSKLSPFQRFRFGHCTYVRLPGYVATLANEPRDHSCFAHQVTSQYRTVAGADSIIEMYNAHNLTNDCLGRFCGHTRVTPIHGVGRFNLALYYDIRNAQHRQHAHWAFHRDVIAKFEEEFNILHTMGYLMPSKDSEIPRHNLLAPTYGVYRVPRSLYKQFFAPTYSPESYEEQWAQIPTYVHIDFAETQPEEETMATPRQDHLIALLQENMTTIAVEFPEGRGSQTLYTYKVTQAQANLLTALMEQQEESGDPHGWDGVYVIVPPTKWCSVPHVARVAEVHDKPKLDLDARYKYVWIMGIVSTGEYENKIAQEEQAKEMLVDVERTKQKNNLLEHLGLKDEHAQLEQDIRQVLNSGKVLEEPEQQDENTTDHHPV